MKMDRDTNPQSLGKYALVLWRAFLALEGDELARAKKALEELKSLGLLDEGLVGTESEFMVFRLRDYHALPALVAYAQSHKASGDLEFAQAVRDMAERSGPNSPFCKEPD